MRVEKAFFFCGSTQQLPSPLLPQASSYDANDAPAFFKKQNLTQTAAVLETLKPDGALLTALKRKVVAKIEAAGTKVAPPGSPTKVRVVTNSPNVTATPSQPYVWATQTTILITGTDFSTNPSG